MAFCHKEKFHRIFFFGINISTHSSIHIYMQCHFLPRVHLKASPKWATFQFHTPLKLLKCKEGGLAIFVSGACWLGEKCLKSTFLSFDKYIWRVASIDLHFSHARLWSELLKVQGGWGWIWSMQESWVGTLQVPSDVQGHPGRHVLGLPLERMNENTKMPEVGLYNFWLKKC